MSGADERGGRRLEGSVEWRGRNSFRVRVSNGIDPLAGTRRWLRASGKGNRKAAERALRDLLSKRDTGLDVPPTRITVDEWLTRWLDGHIADGRVGARVAENYRSILIHHLVPFLGHIRLQELRADHVLALKGDLLTRRAPATTKKVLGVLRQSLNAAVDFGLLARNPAGAIPGPSMTAAGTERRALSEDEVSALVSAAAGTSLDVPLRLTVGTGLRQAELLGLQWEAIDLGRETLLVNRTLAYVDRQFLLLPPKTRHSHRTIELSAATVGLLEAHRASQNAQRRAPGPEWLGGDLVFPCADGSPQYRQAFLRAFRRVVAEAELDRPETVNWHTLRHTAASLWIKAGVDIFTVSRRLGHSSASFTMDVYGHLLTGQQRGAAEALDHLITAT